MNKNTVNKLLKDFGVETEEQLQKKLAEEAKVVPCIHCGKEFPIDELYFIDGDPYCRRCK
jgi:hypothetical protein